MAPERLQTIEDAAKDAIASDVQTGGFARDALDLIAEIRRLTADLASAHADADAWRRSTRAVEAERDAAVARAETGLRREDALAAEIVALTDAREHMQAERDAAVAQAQAAVAQAQASAEEARVLRGAARPFADGLMDDGRYQSGASGFFFEVASPEEAQALKAALATSPTAHAKLAKARAEVIEAERAPGGLPGSPEWTAKFNRLRTAKEALADAEREADRHYVRAVVNGSDQREVAAAQERRRLADEALRGAEKEAEVVADA